MDMKKYLFYVSLLLVSYNSYGMFGLGHALFAEKLPPFHTEGAENIHLSPTNGNASPEKQTMPLQTSPRKQHHRNSKSPSRKPRNEILFRS